MKLLFIFLFSAITAFAQTPEWSRKYHTGAVNCLQFSKDGTKLLTGGADGKVMLWDISKSDTIRSFKKFNAQVLSVNYNSKDSWFIVSTQDFSTYILDPALDTALKTIKISEYIQNEHHMILYGSIYTKVAYSSNQDSNLNIISGGGVVQYYQGAEGGGVSGKNAIFIIDSNKLTETNSGNHYAAFKISEDKKYNAFVAYSTFYPTREHSKAVVLKNYHSTSVTLSKIDSSAIYNLESFYEQYGRNDDKLGNDKIMNLGFTGDSKYILSYNRGNKVYVRSVNDKAIIDSLGSAISGISELSGDMRGRYYITAHVDSTLRLWTRGNHNVFKKIKLPSNITKNVVATIAVSPDSVHFATAHTDGTVALWNIDSLFLKAQTDSVFTPSIVSISGNKTVCEGSEVVFTVSAQSNFGEKLLYQWRKNGMDLPQNDSINNVNTQAVILKNIDKTDDGQYSVVVSSEKGGQIASQNISLKVISEPVIAKHPQRTIYRKGIYDFFIFSVELTDPTAVNYQWYKNGNAIPGATYGYFEFPIQDSNLHIGEYYVVVTNDCGNEKSSSIKFGNVVSITEANPFKNTTLSAEPNPFKNSTTIRFSLPKLLKIKLAVTDILGREVAVLKNEFVEMGEQNVVFKNENLPDGTYFITLSGDGFLKTIPVQITR